MISQLIRAASLLTALLATSCAPPAIGAEEAPGYFAEHQAEFEDLLQQVELCQPPEGRLDPSSDFQCDSSAGSAQAVREAMRAADAQWMRAYYDQRENEPRALSSLWIAMPSSYGFTVGGVVETFIYEAAPAIEVAYERTDDGISIVERQPVTGAPHHWYWQKIDR